MTKPGSDDTLRITRHLHAPAERVFDAWLDPSRAGRWLFATAEGEMVRVEIDARVGGRWTFVRRDPDGPHAGDTEHVGEYLEIDRPRRLVFTFSVPRYDGDRPPTRVEVDVAPDGAGCVLTLAHHGVPAEWREPTTEGWTMILGGLAKEIEE